MTLSHNELLDSSLSAALAAIEIYNKVRITYREQLFTILMVNAWELLLKAKLLLDNNESIEALFVRLSDGTFKKNRSKAPLTIDALAAATKLDISMTAYDNIASLVEIRDSVIHFHRSEPLSCIVFSLGVASLQNYHRVMRGWFGRSLAEFDFFILPLGFDYRFVTLATIDVQAQPEHIASLLRTVTECQNRAAEDTEFFFACEIRAQITSAKRASGEGDIAVTVETNPSDGTPSIFKDRHLIETFPFTYTELAKRVRQHVPGTNQNHINRAIKEKGIKNDRRYAAPNWKSRQQKHEAERTGIVPDSVPYIYNMDAILFLAAIISEQLRENGPIPTHGIT